MTGVAGVVSAGGDPARARALAESLGLPLCSQLPDQGLVLAVTADHLALSAAGQTPIHVDFHADRVLRRARSAKRSPLARALGLHRRPAQSVFDATCGLARDAAVLMHLGCSVLACERDPVLRTLIEDGVARASPLPRWRGLLATDACQWLAQSNGAVADVVYLDPMFDHDRRALPQLSMQLLHALVGVDTDAGALLAQARHRAGRRVVVKRHPRSAPLAAPDTQVRGKRARYDIYLTQT